MTALVSGYLRQAMELSKSLHNQIYFLSKVLGISIAGDDELGDQFAKSRMESLYTLVKCAYEQGDEIPEYLPLQNGAKVDISKWKRAIVDKRSSIPELMTPTVEWSYR